MTTEIDVKAWFRGKDLSTDWTSRNFPIWITLFSERRSAELDILEIGAWEGRSAVFFLNFFYRSRITCIDTFAGSIEHLSNPDLARLVPDCERRFDFNLGEFGERVEKLKATSHSALPSLATRRRRFDIVYVDGSHRSTDVYTDAALVWPMMKAGGVVIFDDYEWRMMKAEEERPKLGVDSFLNGMRGSFRELYRGHELIVEKL